MASLGYMDDMEREQVTRGLNGYGTIISGGTPDERRDALLGEMEDPVVVVDGRDMDSATDVWLHILREAYGEDEMEGADPEIIGVFEVRVALMEEEQNVAIIEYDSMDEETQQTVGQAFKGVCERRGFEQQLGYTAEDNESIFRQVPDLSMRVYPTEIR